MNKKAGYRMDAKHLAAFVAAQILTLSRFFSVVIPGYVRKDEFAAAILLTLAFMLTDWLDGKCARWSGHITRFGIFIDPIADAIFCGSLVVAVMTACSYSWDLLTIWFLIGSYFFINGAYVAIARVARPDELSNEYAKWKMGILMSSLLLALCGEALPDYKLFLDALAFIGIGMSIVLSVLELKEYRKTARKI